MPSQPLGLSCAMSTPFSAGRAGRHHAARRPRQLVPARRAATASRCSAPPARAPRSASRIASARSRRCSPRHRAVATVVRRHRLCARRRGRAGARRDGRRPARAAAHAAVVFPRRLRRRAVRLVQRVLRNDRQGAQRLSLSHPVDDRRAAVGRPDRPAEDRLPRRRGRREGLIRRLAEHREAARRASATCRSWSATSASSPARCGRAARARSAGSPTCMPGVVRKAAHDGIDDPRIADAVRGDHALSVHAGRQDADRAPARRRRAGA